MRSIPKILVLWGLGAFSEPWSLFLFLHMEEWVQDATTGISSVFRQFLITDPLPMIQIRLIPRFFFILEPRSLFRALEPFPILIYIYIYIYTYIYIYLYLYIGEWLQDARTGIYSVCPQFLITNLLPSIHMRSIPRC